MKNKKKLLIISVIALLIILVGVCCYFIFHKDKKVYNENNNKIVSKEEYIGYKYDSEKLENYYINNGNRIIGFNKKDGNKLFEIEMPLKYFYKIINSNEDIIKLYSYQDESDDLYKLYNINGDLLKSSKKSIKFSNDTYNNKSYYIYESSLYNENNEIISENLFKNIDIENGSFRFNVYGSYLIYTNNSIGKILNINKNKSIDIKSYFSNEKFVEIESKNNFYLLDLEKDELDEYAISEEKPYGKILYKNEQKYVYTNFEIIKYEEKLEHERYQFDFTACNDGFNIYYSEKLLSNECFYQYNKDKNNNIYVNNSKTFYLRDGKLVEKIPIGNYFINNYSGENIIVYNEKDEQVSDACSNGFDYYRNGLYVCNDGINSYLVNESLKKVTDSYDEIVCSDTYCKMFQNEKYGLLYNDKVILKPVYSSINLLNNAIIAEDSYKLDYFLLGIEKFLSEDKLYREIDDYKNINIEQIINDYNLNDIENLINDDSDFFKQYAFVVQNNNNLNGFKEYVLNAYKEVIMNKEHLDKEYFLYNLKNLSIERVNKIDIPNVTGEYTNNTIHILNTADKRTLYHELTHFIDDRLNSKGGFKSITIYKYLGNYITTEEFYQLSKAERKKAEYIEDIFFNFLVEGGAEYNTAVYFNNMKPISYYNQVVMYNILSIIYGTDFMREIFFGREGQELLYKKIVEAGYNYDEIKRFTDITLRTEIDKANNKEKFYYLEMLINLYEHEKGAKWYEDKTFSYFVISLLPYDFKSSDTDRYFEYSKVSNIGITLERKIREKLYDKKYASIYNKIYFNDNLYIPVDDYIIVNGELKDQSKVYIYDIDKDELIDYKTIDE